MSIKVSNNDDILSIFVSIQELIASTTYLKKEKKEKKKKNEENRKKQWINIQKAFQRFKTVVMCSASS